MIIRSVWQKSFDFFAGKPIFVEPAETQLTSDAGLLPIRQFDERIGLTRQFIAALSDPRHPSYVDHTFAEMARARIYGILADYADQNDHDALRNDPVFKLLAGRSPKDHALASQPTLSRFENQIDIRSRIESGRFHRSVHRFLRRAAAPSDLRYRHLRRPDTASSN
jgi:hypothetical protein